MNILIADYYFYIYRAKSHSRYPRSLSLMHNTRLIAVLRTFSEKEMKQFEKWMSSPLHNSNSTLLALTHHLCVYHPAFKDEHVDKTTIAALLYPGETYNDARMRNLTSDFQEQAENFLVWINLNREEVPRKQLLLDELNKRKLGSIFASRLKETRAALKNSGLDMLSWTIQNFLVDREEYEYHYTSNYGKVFKAFNKFDNKKMIHSVTDLYLSNLLYYYHITIDNERIFGKKDYSFEKLEQLAEELYNETGQTNILTLVYLKIIKLLRTGSDKYYFEIKKELQRKEFDALYDHDRQSVVTVLTNFALGSHLKGKKGFMKELLELSQIALQKKLCFRDGFISHIFFFNYTYYNVSIGKVEEAKKFVSRYKEFLQDELRESTLQYSMAYIYLGEKKFSDALVALNQVGYDTPQRFIGIKNTLLKIYFEKNDLEPISFLVDSIRHKLVGASFLSDYLQVAEKNFLHCYNILLRIRVKGLEKTSKQLAELKKKLEDTDYIFHREWLTEMAQSLKK
jgi:hypothetical protein